MSQKYTPGPWVVEGETIDRLRVRADLRFSVAKVLRLDSLSETAANAHLIAAAPTLYDFAVKEAKNGNEFAKQMLASLKLGD